MEQRWVPAPVDRRRFLQGLLVVGAGVGVQLDGAAGAQVSQQPGHGPTNTTPGPLLTRIYRRPGDGVLLTFAIHNLRIVRGSNPAVLRRVNKNKPAFITVTFPPQTIAEEHIRLQGVGFESDLDGRTVPRGQLRHRQGLPSRLAFRFEQPDDIPLTPDTLLDWRRWNLSVVPLALPAGHSVAPPTAARIPRAPGADETAIELPWMLQLSPASGTPSSTRRIPSPGMVAPSCGTPGWRSSR